MKAKRRVTRQDKRGGAAVPVANTKPPAAPRDASDGAAILVFSLALLLSALLLFWLQPLTAKMLLPSLGGTPAVWNTTMVFYQTILLAGYLYAHLTSTRLTLATQLALHGALMGAACFFLPPSIALGAAPPPEANPILWLLGVLAVSVGLPALVLSSTAPLLQRWLSLSGVTAGRDPYFLYAASNLGSLGALAAYPLVFEPLMKLREQAGWWSGVFALLGGLLVAAALFTRRGARGKAPAATADTSTEGAAAVTGAQALRWIALACVPSSLLLGVTTHITTDIAAVPLLWIVPLALYLLTYVIAFSRKPLVKQRWVLWLQPLLLLPLAVLFAIDKSWSHTSFPLHLLAFFVTALACHGELVRTRPSPEHLTLFYICISLGGWIGGVFNALIAPFLFTSVMEYPLMVAAAAFLRPGATGNQAPGGGRLRHLLWPGALAVGLAAALWWLRGGGASYPAALTVVCGLAAVAVFFMRARPVRFGLGVVAILLFGKLALPRTADLLFAERNFFGINRIVAEGQFRILYHGRIVHGAQNLRPEERREPLTYFSRVGPLGELFAAGAGRSGQGRIAIIGLGAGSIAAYGRPGQEITYFEIDPAVERIARDSGHFTFLADSPAQVRTVIGDARLSLLGVADGSFDLIVIDAFSSDAIPVHLLTREAIALYRAKLTPQGMIAFNITNNYLNLAPVLAALARDAGLICVVKQDARDFTEEILSMRLSSRWAAMTAQWPNFGSLGLYPGWGVPAERPGVRAWTDDYSNIVSIFLR